MASESDIPEGSEAQPGPGGDWSEARDINEAGEKTVTLVTVNDDRSLTAEERATSFAQFERISVDLSSAVRWREAINLHQPAGPACG